MNNQITIYKDDYDKSVAYIQSELADEQKKTPQDAKKVQYFTQLLRNMALVLKAAKVLPGSDPSNKIISTPVNNTGVKDTDITNEKTQS